MTDELQKNLMLLALIIANAGLVIISFSLIFRLAYARTKLMIRLPEDEAKQASKTIDSFWSFLR